MSFSFLMKKKKNRNMKKNGKKLFSLLLSPDQVHRLGGLRRPGLCQRRPLHGHQRVDRHRLRVFRERRERLQQSNAVLVALAQADDPPAQTETPASRTAASVLSLSW